MYADYKAGRHAMPDELRAQMPVSREFAEMLGLHILDMEGYEADDILGTVSAACEREGREAVIVTGDRDSFQLAGEKTTILYTKKGITDTVRVTPEYIMETYGLAPVQLIDVKGLMGDTSDNIPGVPGVGEKTALKLIAERGSLDGVYEELETLPVGPSAKEKLREGKEEAYRSRFLGEICREVPGLTAIEDFPYSGFVPELLLPLFVELEFTKMIQSFGLDQPAPADETPLQGSLFDLAEEKRHGFCRTQSFFRCEYK